MLEYLVIRVGYREQSDTLQSALNDMTASGWDFVQALDSKNDGCILAIFSRRKP